MEMLVRLTLEVLSMYLPLLARDDVFEGEGPVVQLITRAGPVHRGRVLSFFADMLADTPCRQILLARAVSKDSDCSFKKWVCELPTRAPFYYDIQDA